MQRTKTLAYESKVPTVPAEKPDSVAPASGIRLVRPPLATLPGASSVPPPPSARPAPRVSTPAPAVRPVAKTLPLAIAPMPIPAAPPAPKLAEVKLPAAKSLAGPKALFGSPKTMVPPPPPSGPRARGISSPPPSKRPPRPGSKTPEPLMLDDDSIVDEDDAPTLAETDDLVEVEATLVSPPSPPKHGAPPRSSRPPSSSTPRKLASLRATGQNWPRVEWPRLDQAKAPRPASVRPSAPRPASSPPPPPAEVAMMVSELEAAELEAAAAAIEPIQPIPDLPADLLPDLGGTAFDAETTSADEASSPEVHAPEEGRAAEIAQLDASATPIPTENDVYVEAAAPRSIAMQMLPPPPTASDLEAEVANTAMVFSDDDVIDFRPVSPLVRLRAIFDVQRLRAALAQLRPIIAWLDRNPRAFASVGFGAGVVVALFVALVVQ